jgi:membrane fusion protein, multidrug efflux system
MSPALLLLIALGACKEPPRPQRPTPTVSVLAAAKGPLPYVVSANGQVEANRTVAVQSLVSGQLTRVAIAEGDEVREGQLLFQIDPRPFRAEVDRVAATLARDEATLTRARADSTRFAALAQDGYITRQQLDQAFAEASALAATVSAGRASLQRARLDLDNTTVRAPITGRTGQLLYKAGSLVRASADQLVTINELRPVLVRFAVPERDFEEMRRRAGLDSRLQVKVRPNGIDTTQVILGELTFVDNQVDQATGSVLLKARVANADRALWPGQFVSVALELSVDQDAITIPSEAVVTTGTSTFVYVLDGDKAVRTAVKVGRPSGTLVKIDSGLVGGEQVITEGQTRLRDGATVQLRGANGGRGGARNARGGGAAGGGAAQAPQGGAR